jgi:hypothetical protein
LIPIVAFGFVAGAVSVLVFHQGVLLMMHAAGLLPFTPYSMAPTSPLGVPQVASSAFWGGLWGVALAIVMERVRGADRWWIAVLFGGVLTSIVAVLVVVPLKGGDPAAWLQPARLAMAFLINGVWGLGSALIYRLARRRLLAQGRP